MPMVSSLKLRMRVTNTPLQRELTGSRLGAHLDLPPLAERYVLVWHKTRGILDLTYSIRSESNHFIFELGQVGLYVFCGGIAMALLFHNLSLYFSMKDPIYLFYLSFVAGSSLQPSSSLGINICSGGRPLPG